MYKNLKILIIDVGHGGTDPGAVGNGIVEKVANLNTALALKAAAEAMGINVFITRTADVTMSLEARVKFANDIARQYPGAKILFVSIHHNAGGGDRAEAIHSIYRGEGQRAANLIANELHSHLGQQKKVYEKRGSDNKDYYYVIRNTSMDAVIVEVAFLDNINDVQICDSVEEQQRNGQVIACAIGKFFGVISSCNDNGEVIKPNPTHTPSPSNELYRVRKLWGDAASQKGAYSIKENAIAECKKHSSYNVYDSDGNVVYSNGGQQPSHPDPTPSQIPSKRKIDSFIKVDGYSWVKNLEDYAGVFGIPVKNFYAYPSEGEILFRVSPVNRDYYPWVQNYRTSTGRYDFAGNGVPIDRVQMKLRGLSGYRIKYRVHLLNGDWLPWVYDDTDYAGIRGKTIDAIETEIV